MIGSTSLWRTIAAASLLAAVVLHGAVLTRVLLPSQFALLPAFALALGSSALASYRTRALTHASPPLLSAAPGWAYFLVPLLLLYAAINFLLSFDGPPGVGETLQYVADSARLLRRDSLIRVLSSAETRQAQFASARMITGHVVLFAGLGFTWWSALLRRESQVLSGAR